MGFGISLAFPRPASAQSADSPSFRIKTQAVESAGSPTSGTSKAVESPAFRAIVNVGRAADDAKSSASFRIREGYIPTLQIGPAVVSLEPPNGSFTNNPRPPIRATYADAGGGVDAAGVRFYIDSGGPTPPTTAMATEAALTLAADLTEGAHTIVVSVPDLGGSIGVAHSTFTVDLTPPTVTAGFLAPGAGFPTSRPFLIGLLSDNLSGVNPASVQVSLDGLPAALDRVDALHFALTPAANLAEGTHSISVTAADNAGNGVTRSGTFVVDTRLPTVAITSPANGSILPPGDVAVAITYSDPLSGSPPFASGIDFARTTVFVDAADQTALFAFGPDSATGVIPAPARGLHAITVELRDRAGNFALASSTFQIPRNLPSTDPTLPTADLLFPVDGYPVRISNPIPVVARVSDNEALFDASLLIDGALSTSTRQLPPSFQLSATGAQATAGTAQVEVKARDAAGNQKSSARGLPVLAQADDDSLPRLSMTAAPHAVGPNEGYAVSLVFFGAVPPPSVGFLVLDAPTAETYAALTAPVTGRATFVSPFWSPGETDPVTGLPTSFRATVAGPFLTSPGATAVVAFDAADNRVSDAVQIIVAPRVGGGSSPRPDVDVFYPVAGLRKFAGDGLRVAYNLADTTSLNHAAFLADGAFTEAINYFFIPQSQAEDAFLRFLDPAQVSGASTTRFFSVFGSNVRAQGALSASRDVAVFAPPAPGTPARIELPQFGSPFAVGDAPVVTLTVRDPNGSAVTSFTGDVRLHLVEAGNTLDFDGLLAAAPLLTVAFAAADNGSKTVTLPPLARAGPAVLFAYVTVEPRASGNAFLRVGKLGGSLAFDAALFESFHAGTVLSNQAVRATDAAGNPLAGATATVTIRQINADGMVISESTFTVTTGASGLAPIPPFLIMADTVRVDMLASSTVPGISPAPTQSVQTSGAIRFNIALEHSVFQAGAPIGITVTALHLDGSIADDFTGTAFLYLPAVEDRLADLDTPAQPNGDLRVLMPIAFRVEDRGVVFIPNAFALTRAGLRFVFVATGGGAGLVPARTPTGSDTLPLTLDARTANGATNEFVILPAAPSRVTVFLTGVFRQVRITARSAVLDAFDNGVGPGVRVRFDFSGDLGAVSDVRQATNGAGLAEAAGPFRPNPFTVAVTVRADVTLPDFPGIAGFSTGTFSPTDPAEAAKLTNFRATTAPLPPVLLDRPAQPVSDMAGTYRDTFQTTFTTETRTVTVFLPLAPGFFGAQWSAAPAATTTRNDSGPGVLSLSTAVISSQPEAFTLTARLSNIPVPLDQNGFPIPTMVTFDFDFALAAAAIDVGPLTLPPGATYFPAEIGVQASVANTDAAHAVVAKLESLHASGAAVMPNPRLGTGATTAPRQGVFLMDVRRFGWGERTTGAVFTVEFTTSRSPGADVPGGLRLESRDTSGAAVLKTPDGTMDLPGAVVNVPLSQVGPNVFRSPPIVAVTAPPQPEAMVGGGGGLVRVQAQSVVTADGVQPGTIKVFIPDAQGMPVSGAAVSISLIGRDTGGTTITQPSLTDASGHATGFVRSSTSGMRAFLVTVITPNGTTTSVGPVRVFFIPDTTPIVAIPGGVLVGTVSADTAEKAEARVFNAKVLSAEFSFQPEAEAAMRPADFAIGKGLSPMFEIKFTDALYFHQLCPLGLARCISGLEDPSLDNLRVGLVVDDGSDETSADRPIALQERLLIPREHPELFDLAGNTLRYFPAGRPGQASAQNLLRTGTNRLQLFAEGFDDRQRQLNLGAQYGHTIRATPIAIAEFILFVNSPPPDSNGEFQGLTTIPLIPTFRRQLERGEYSPLKGQIPVVPPIGPIEPPEGSIAKPSIDAEEGGRLGPQPEVPLPSVPPVPEHLNFYNNIIYLQFREGTGDAEMSDFAIKNGLKPIGLVRDMSTMLVDISRVGIERDLLIPAIVSADGRRILDQIGEIYAADLAEVLWELDEQNDFRLMFSFHLPGVNPRLGSVSFPMIAGFNEFAFVQRAPRIPGLQRVFIQKVPTEPFYFEKVGLVLTGEAKGFGNLGAEGINFLADITAGFIAAIIDGVVDTDLTTNVRENARSGIIRSSLETGRYPNVGRAIAAIPGNFIDDIDEGLKAGERGDWQGAGEFISGPILDVTMVADMGVGLERTFLRASAQGSVRATTRTFIRSNLRNTFALTTRDGVRITFKEAFQAMGLRARGALFRAGLDGRQLVQVSDGLVRGGTLDETALAASAPKPRAIPPELEARLPEIRNILDTDPAAQGVQVYVVGNPKLLTPQEIAAGKLARDLDMVFVGVGNGAGNGFVPQLSDSTLRQINDIAKDLGYSGIQNFGTRLGIPGATTGGIPLDIRSAAAFHASTQVGAGRIFKNVRSRMFWQRIR